MSSYDNDVCKISESINLEAKSIKGAKYHLYDKRSNESYCIDKKIVYNTRSRFKLIRVNILVYF